MALTDQTLAQLRGRVADRFGDRVVLDATANGTTTTFVDTANVNSGAESYDGRQILFTSGSNAAKVGRITATNTNGTLTFTPAQVSTATGDDAELYNKHGRGFLVAELHRAINGAIEELHGIALVPVIESIAAVYDSDTQTVAMPATTREVCKIEYENSDDQWTEIKRSVRRGTAGWTAEASAGVVRIEGNPARFADTYAVRLHGFKEQAALSVDADVCSYDGHAVVAIAAYRLCMANLRSDSFYGSLMLTLQGEYEKSLTRARTPRPAGCVKVRS